MNVGGRNRAAKALFAALIILLVVLQARLWVSEDGFAGVWRLRDSVGAQKERNQELASRNRRLEAEVKDLKSGFSALEERARSDLGLIAPDETFYLVGEAESDDGREPAGD